MICPKHDRTGFYETCEHVDAELQNGTRKEFRRLYYWFDLMVCDACWVKYDFSHFENHPEIAGRRFYEMFEDTDEETPIMQEYNAAYDKLSRRAWCVKCYAELQQ